MPLYLVFACSSASQPRLVIVADTTTIITMVITINTNDIKVTNLMRRVIAATVVGTIDTTGTTGTTSMTGIATTTGITAMNGLTGMNVPAGTRACLMAHQAPVMDIHLTG